jgi:hypothetical protein
MSRPYTDISVVNSDQPIKNGTIVGLTTPNGLHTKYNLYVKNEPTINDIYNKYGNKFYNGIFIQIVGGQTIVGA